MFTVSEVSFSLSLCCRTKHQECPEEKVPGRHLVAFHWKSSVDNTEDTERPTGLKFSAGLDLKYLLNVKYSSEKWNLKEIFS